LFIIFFFFLGVVVDQRNTMDRGTTMTIVETRGGWFFSALVLTDFTRFRKFVKFHRG